ncbi:MAG: chemotaxis protein CheW [Cyanobacteriota bacterium]
MPKININLDNIGSDKLLKRTRFLSKEIDDQSNKDKTEFIIFSIQNTDFAIDSRYLVEVISDFSLQSFSFLPSFIKGIVNVKGNVIPVNDLSFLIFDKTQINDYEIIRIKYKNIDTAIAVDFVKKIDFIFNNCISNTEKYKYTRNMIEIDNNLIYILDLQAFFNDESIIINDN